MKKIDDFKEFVKTKPSLINYVKNNEMSWQKFYELWDLYGPNHDLWLKYNEALVNSSSSFNMNDLAKVVKNLDTQTIQQGISGLQKGIALIQDLIKKNDQPTPNVINEPYRPRPFFRRFDD